MNPSREARPQPAEDGQWEIVFSDDSVLPFTTYQTEEMAEEVCRVINGTHKGPILVTGTLVGD